MENSVHEAKRAEEACQTEFTLKNALEYLRVPINEYNTNVPLWFRIKFFEKFGRNEAEGPGSHSSSPAPHPPMQC